MEENCNLEPFVFTIEIKKLRDNAKIPTRGSEYAAGYDLYAAIDHAITIQSHMTEKIGTGLAMACPIDFWIGIYSRSGIATKRGLRPANCVGIIDPDYRGEIIVALHNDTDQAQTIEPGERIGQMVLMPLYTVNFEEKEGLKNTVRGAGGFGDSGKF